MSERIDIDLVNLAHQKPIENKYCYIELQETLLKYYYDFKADEPNDKDDLELGWSESRNVSHCIALKKSVSGIEKYWCTTNKRWAVYIMLTGFATDLKAFFRKEEEAQNLFDKLERWLLYE